MHWWTGLDPIRATVEWATSAGLPDWLIFLIPGLLPAIALLLLALISQIVMVFWERRLLGQFQIRIGPNRTGPNGTLQLVADALKAVGKELVLPEGADKVMYWLAPLVALQPAFLSFVVLTFGPGQVAINMDVGVLFFQAVTSLGALIIFMAGWASNNKFALFGAMRGVAQFVAYEIPLVLSILTVVLLVGSMSTIVITDAQNTIPFILVAPVAFVVFAIASLAELNRTPMDLMEAESEIVAGYHTEYGGMAWLMMYGSEYVHMLGFGAMLNILFLGGWRFFWLETFIPPWILFIVKSYLVFFVLVWLRASLPRVRIDQLMNLGWKTLTPLAVLSLVLTAGAILAFPQAQLLAVGVVQWVVMGAIAVVTLSRSGRRRQVQREQAETRRSANARPVGA